MGARIARARRASPRAPRRRGVMAAAPPPPRELTESGAGVFLADLRRLRRHPRPLADRARAGRRGARRRTRRAQVPGHRRRGRSRARPRFGLRQFLRRRRRRVRGRRRRRVHSCRRRPRPPAKKLWRREPRRAAAGSQWALWTCTSRAAATSRTPAWRDVDLRAGRPATPAALCILRGVACGAVRDLDVTGSRSSRAAATSSTSQRESPQLRTPRCAACSGTNRQVERSPMVTWTPCSRRARRSRALRVRRWRQRGAWTGAHGVLECAAVVARAGRLGGQVDAQLVPQTRVTALCSGLRGDDGAARRRVPTAEARPFARRTSRVRAPCYLPGRFAEVPQAVAAKEKGDAGD